MKLTYRWLSDFVDLPEDAGAVAAALESLGFEVEEMRPLDVTFRGVVVGRVEDVRLHPDADKVRLCTVDIGSTTSEIVCGAWNFEAGAIVPVAVPGAVLGGDFEIGRRKIRGVVSEGMICSERELDLGHHAEGIMVLDGEYPEARDALGGDFASLLPLPDTYFDVDVNPNRPDCMSVLGLARELAAHFGVELREPDYAVVEHDPASTVTVAIEDAEACPRFVGRELRNVTVGPSPHWIRMRLEAAGVRPISNVVDASNYAMIEVGHPTHAFDADRLGDTVVVRRATEGEKVMTLDGVERALLGSDIVVADGTRPVAVAGVMGGADTEVEEGTTRVLVEAAYWHPASILMTSKRLGLRSEASARFERGMDPNFCHLAADRVTQLLAAGGAEVVSGRIDEYPQTVEPRVVSLPLSEIGRVLGVDVARPAAVTYLERLGFDVGGDDPIVVAVPTRRPDVRRPVDLVEEVARLYGYDHLPERVATGFGGGLPAGDRNVRKVRGLMAGAGYDEVLLFSFIGEADLDALGLDHTDPRREGVRVVNPLRDEEGVMRTTLLPGLLKAVAVNQDRHIDGAALFEIGKVFMNEGGELPEQPEHLGFVLVGLQDGDWAVDGRQAEVRDATGLWEMLAAHMRVTDPGLRSVTSAPFHPGRAAEAVVGGVAVGVVGEIHPTVAAAFGIEGRVVAGELDLGPLVGVRDDWVFSAPSVFPPALFDLAFELDLATPVGDALDAVAASGGEVLETFDVFDVFTGDPLPPGRKSLGIRLMLRDRTKTLTDEEAGDVRRRIVDAVETATGGSLRGRS
ncbi:MAG: phenylalanine--tRNA ligase subunit beta [Acidimicrobiia bacterium]